MACLRCLARGSCLLVLHTFSSSTASFSDSAGLFQQAIGQQHFVTSEALPDACRPLPRPLHYNYGKYAGAYSMSTVMWTEDEFRAIETAAQPGMYGRVAAVMHKLQQGGTLQIVVFGGSGSAGTGCRQQRVRLKDCAWPARFQHWLGQAFPNGHVNLTNLAQGGSTSSSILAGVGLMLRALDGPVDVIFVDTLTNDIYTPQKDEVPGERRLELDAVGAIAHEQLLRTLQRLAPQAVIFPVLAGCDGCRKHGELYREVVAHYNLARLDWGEFVERKPHLGDGPDVHPRYYAHQSMADVLALQWAVAWDQHCARPDAGVASELPEPHWDLRYLSAFKPCIEPLSAFVASVPETAKAVTLGPGWELREDRPGKPGWISETPGSQISFPVRFGQHPSLVLTWLRSYEKLGTAVLKLNGREYSLDGLWSADAPRQCSLAYTRWLQVDEPKILQKSEEVGVAGFNIRPWANLTMTISLPNNSSQGFSKMAIYQVFTC